MKKHRLLILTIMLMAVMILSSCAGKSEPSAPTPPPEDTMTPATPSPAPTVTTEPPINTAEPPKAVYPVPDFLEGAVSIQPFLDGEDISFLCQSAVGCGAVTSSGRLLLWSLASDTLEVYRTDSLETIYTTNDIENITAAWLSDSENFNINFALDRDGQLWGFGWNARGLIPGYGVEMVEPVIVMEHISSFAMGRDLLTTWAAAVEDTGAVVIWGYDHRTGPAKLVLPTVIASGAVSVINTCGDHLYIVTTNGDLVDLGPAREFFYSDYVVKTLVKEDAVWGSDDYVLGADGVLYYRESDKAWSVIAEDVKMANCNEPIAFYLTNTGELYAWENEDADWFPELRLPAGPSGEKYIKLLDGVAMAAPAKLGTGITALLENGSMVQIDIHAG